MVNTTTGEETLQRTGGNVFLCYLQHDSSMTADEEDQQQQQQRTGTTTSPSTNMDAGTENNSKLLKHKRRYCRFPGCPRIVKSQGLCQRHGARPRKCKVEGCGKQAQGNFERMCKLHFKESRRRQTRSSSPLDEGDEDDDVGDHAVSAAAAAPTAATATVTTSSSNAALCLPTAEGTSVYDHILPDSISFLPEVDNDVMPLVAHLKEGFDANKPTAWHRNEERRARGLWPVSKPSIQLEGWERELVWMEILVLTGTPSANFRHLARAWGRDKGFHTIISQFICERHGDVERKPRQRSVDTSNGAITKKTTRTPLTWASDGIHLPGKTEESDDDGDDDDDYDEDDYYDDCDHDEDAFKANARRRFHEQRQHPPDFIMSNLERSSNNDYSAWIGRSNSTNSSNSGGGNVSPMMRQFAGMTAPPAARSHHYRPRKGKRDPTQMNPMDDINEMGHYHDNGADVLMDGDPTTTTADALAAYHHMMNTSPYVAQLPLPQLPHQQQQQHQQQRAMPPSSNNSNADYPFFPFPHSFPWSTV